MDNALIMLMLLLIVVVGFVANRLGYMGGDFDKKFSSIIVDITCPALILSSVMGDTLPDRRLIPTLLGVGFITYALLSVLAFTLPKLYCKGTGLEGIHGFATMFGNVGFIGYPIVASIFGPTAVFYAAILNVPNTLFIFTAGTTLIAGNQERRGFNWKILVCSSMIAAYLAILIVALGIDDIPKVIAQPLTMIGNITVPGALLIIGSSLAQIPARQILGNRRVYITTALRLVVVPVTLFFLFSWMGFNTLVVDINTVIIAMPVATYGTIFCLKYGRDTTEMTEITFITSLLSVLTIPAVTLLFTHS